MRATDLDRLHGTLRRFDFFEEWLLHDVRAVLFGYGIDLTLNSVRDERGRMRTDVLERPILVTLRLKGVETLNFVGGLTAAMRANPEHLDWGLTEISRIEARESAQGLSLSVSWENNRRLDVEFSTWELLLRS
jgi:hypothetical protein